MPSLAESSLLSTLTIKQWSARKFDKRISEEVCAEKGANPGSGNFNKQLIPKEFLKKVQRIVNSTRNYHYDNTLAWSHDGTELLPANHYINYTQAMELYRDEFNSAVDEFIADYPALITKVMNSLNDMYNTDDYPSQEELRARFSMDYVITPVPESDDFRIDMPKAEINKLQQDLANRLAEASDAAAKDLYMRLYTVVAKAVVVLKTPGKIFRNSLILNILELSGKIPDLNFNGDKDLLQLAKDANIIVNMIDIEALRLTEKSKAFDVTYRAGRAETLALLLKDIETIFTLKWSDA